MLNENLLLFLTWSQSIPLSESLQSAMSNFSNFIYHSVRSIRHLMVEHWYYMPDFWEHVNLEGWWERFLTDNMLRTHSTLNQWEWSSSVFPLNSANKWDTEKEKQSGLFTSIPQWPTEKSVLLVSAATESINFKILVLKGRTFLSRTYRWIPNYGSFVDIFNFLQEGRAWLTVSAILFCGLVDIHLEGPQF